MAIGGAINRKAPAVLQEFLRRAGGGHARIAVLPQASTQKDTGAYYRDYFGELGCRHVSVVEFDQRTEADLPEHIRLVRRASGIFIAGGNQTRITVRYGGTRLEAELLAAYRRGAAIAGTSAGAAVLSKMMIAFGKPGGTPRLGLAQLAPGFGFTDKMIFDQHFRQRDRLGRLIYAVTTYPGLLGVGVDEDTAAIVEDDARLLVEGSGAVTLVDGASIEASDVAELKENKPVAVSRLTVHVLTRGCRYDLRKRQASLSEKILEVE